MSEDIDITNESYISETFFLLLCEGQITELYSLAIAVGLFGSFILLLNSQLFVRIVSQPHLSLYLMS